MVPRPNLAAGSRRALPCAWDLEKDRTRLLHHLVLCFQAVIYDCRNIEPERIRSTLCICLYISMEIEIANMECIRSNYIRWTSIYL